MVWIGISVLPPRDDEKLCISEARLVFTFYKIPPPVFSEHYNCSYSISASSPVKPNRKPPPIRPPPPGVGLSPAYVPYLWN